MSEDPSERSGSDAELRLTVIVPVWNGAHEIQPLLDALERQTAPRDAYEIIVVDNGSTDATSEIVAARPGIRLLTEPRPGSYAARNMAIEHAGGRFLLFTDADCVPAPDWIETALKLAEMHGEERLIGGRVELFSVGRTGPSSLRYERLTAFQQEWNIANDVCVTANWLCSKALLEKVDRFDASLMSGGDADCSRRIAAAGYGLIYAPDLVVGHPTRATLPALVRKRRRVIGGRWQRATGKQGFASFSRMLMSEHFGQARWMKNLAIPKREVAGVLLVVGVMWLTAQSELIRLKAGGRATRV